MCCVPFSPATNGGGHPSTSGGGHPSTNSNGHTTNCLPQQKMLSSRPHSIAVSREEVKGGGGR